MRIGIAGAQSVGKTTLINALRSEPSLKQYHICHEVTRRVKSYGHGINEDGNDITQRLIMQEHIVNVFMHEDMITDRTALDGLVYSAYMHAFKKISDETYLYAEKVFEKLLPYYDIIFYIEPEFEIIDDGVRSTDKKFRSDVIKIFDEAIKIKAVKVHKISGSVRERVEQVLKVIEEYNGQSTKTKRTSRGTPRKSR